MLADGSLYQKQVKNASVMTAYAPETFLHGLKSHNAYLCETKLFRVHMVPFCFQNLGAPFFKIKMEPCEVSNFYNPLFPMNSVCMTYVMRVHDCNTSVNISKGILLPCDYIEKLEFIGFHLSFENGAPSF